MQALWAQTQGKRSSTAGAGGGSDSAPAHSSAAVLLSQILFTLSCYLNNKMGTVNDNLHFRSCFSQGIWKIWMNPHNILPRRIGIINSILYVRRGGLTGVEREISEGHVGDECGWKFRCKDASHTTQSIAVSVNGTGLSKSRPPESNLFSLILSSREERLKHLPFCMNPRETLHLN